MEKENDRKGLLYEIVDFISNIYAGLVVGSILAAIVLVWDIGTSYIPSWVLVCTGMLFSVAVAIAVKKRDWSGVGYGMLMLFAACVAFTFRHYAAVEGDESQMAKLAEAMATLISYGLPITAGFFAIARPYLIANLSSSR